MASIYSLDRALTYSTSHTSERRPRVKTTQILVRELLYADNSALVAHSAEEIQKIENTTQDSHNMCSNCSHVEKTHNARYQRQEQKSLQHDTIKSNDPLHSVTGHQMKEVFYDTFLAVIKIRVESRNLYLAIT